MGVLRASRPRHLEVFPRWTLRESRPTCDDYEMHSVSSARNVCVNELCGVSRSNAMLFKIPLIDLSCLLESRLLSSPSL
jgi:hypothetical protein